MKFFKSEKPVSTGQEDESDLDKIAEIAETGEWEEPSFDPEDELDADKLFEENGEWIKLNSIMDNLRPKTEKARKKAVALIHAGLAMTAFAGIAVEFGAATVSAEPTELGEHDEGDEAPPKLKARTLALLESIEVDRSEQIETGNLVNSDKMHDLEREYWMASADNNDLSSELLEDNVIDEMYNVAKNGDNVQDLMLARSRMEKKKDMDALNEILRNTDNEDSSGADKQVMESADEQENSDRTNDRNIKIQELEGRIQEKINRPIPEGELSDAQKDDMAVNFGELKAMYLNVDEFRNNGDDIYRNMYEKAMASGRIANLLDTKEMMATRELKEHDALDLPYSQQSAEYNKLERKIFDTIALLDETSLNEARHLLHSKDTKALVKLCNENGIT